MNKELLKSAAFVGAGLACGYGVGYFITKKRLEKKYQEEAQVEIDEVKAHYKAETDKIKKLQKAGEYETVADTAEALANKREVLTEEEVKAYNEAITENGYAEAATVNVLNIWQTPISSIDGDETAEEPDVENEANWPGNPDDEEEDGDDEPADNYEIIRSASKPYIIGVEEYMTDDDDYEKLSLGFYEEDGVLTDDRDKPVSDIENTVGLLNLDHFGLLSGSKSSLYVRNERIHADIEINLESGSYTEIILGKKYQSEPVSRSKRVPRNDE